MKTNQRSVFSLVALPALISLAVTLLRLVGELERWSPKWFLSGDRILSWLIDPTWLVILFGAYFSFRLAAAGQSPMSIRKAYICVAAGVAILAGAPQLIPLRNVGFRTGLILDACFMTTVAVIQLWAWPGLFKVLLAYGLASRIPIAIIMCLGLRGHWGTDFDYVGTAEFDLPVPGYFWRAIFPQLMVWVGFTILLGSISGVITSDITGARNRDSKVVGTIT